MKKVFLILAALFLLAGCAALEKTQKQNAIRMAESEIMQKLPFELAYASYVNDSLFSRLDIYIGLRFSDLVFEKSEGDSFVASYDMQLNFYKLPDRQQAGSDSWERKVKVATYAETQERNRGVQLFRSYRMRPGKYEIRFIVTDMNIPASADYRTKTVASIVGVRDYSRFSISDLMLVEKVQMWDEHGRAEKLSPSFWRSSPRDSVLSFYFEMYHLRTDTAVRIFYNITDKNDDQVISDSLYADVPYPSFGHLLNIAMRDIPNGTYLLNIVVNQDSFFVFKNIYFGYYYWLSADFAIRNLEEAVKQLRYIVPEKQLAKMLQAKGKEKEELFLAYWRKRDPSPATEENELMAEYYTRAQAANERFRYINLAGWKTDRGMIYITFGEPDNIDYHPMDIDSRPYEVWSYYFDVKRGKRIFIFVDRNGSGDYRLTEPFDPIFDKNRRR